MDRRHPGNTERLLSMHTGSQTWTMPSLQTLHRKGAEGLTGKTKNNDRLQIEKKKTVQKELNRRLK